MNVIPVPKLKSSEQDYEFLHGNPFDKKVRFEAHNGVWSGLYRIRREVELLLGASYHSAEL